MRKDWNQMGFLLLLLCGIGFGGPTSKLMAQEMSGIEWGESYTIAGLTVVGAEYTDAQAVKLFSALQIGQEITLPGEEISKAIRNLWVQQLFDDIAIELADLPFSNW